MSTFLALCGCALWVVSMGFTLYGTLLARRHFRTKVTPGTAPPISILKPLKGLEPRLNEAIESFFQIQYRGGFELVFCVSDSDDPALPLARELAVRYAEVSSRILIGDDQNFPNPKAGNTQKAYVGARHDVLLISDSNVIVKSDYLDRIAPLMRPDTGLVTGVVAGVSANTFAGYIEAATLNTFSARWMLIGSRVGAPIVMGKSMLFDRRDADRFGGLKTLGLYLAEDYMAGHAMVYLNKKVVIMNDPVTQIISDYRFKTFWLRHVRWGRLRRAQSPFAYFAEPLVSCVPIGVIGSTCLAFLFNCPLGPVFAVHLALWFFSDLHLVGSLRTQRGWRFAIGWVVKEILYIPMWCHSLAGRTVHWRGRRLRVQAGGLLAAN